MLKFLLSLPLARSPFMDTSWACVIINSSLTSSYLKRVGAANRMEINKNFSVINAKWQNIY